MKSISLLSLLKEVKLRKIGELTEIYKIEDNGVTTFASVPGTYDIFVNTCEKIGNYKGYDIYHYYKEVDSEYIDVFVDNSKKKIIFEFHYKKVDGGIKPICIWRSTPKQLDPKEIQINLYLNKFHKLISDEQMTDNGLGLWIRVMKDAATKGYHIYFIVEYKNLKNIKPDKETKHIHIPSWIKDNYNQNTGMSDVKNVINLISNEEIKDVITAEDKKSYSIPSIIIEK